MTMDNFCKKLFPLLVISMRRLAAAACDTSLMLWDHLRNLQKYKSGTFLCGILNHPISLLIISAS